MKLRIIVIAVLAFFAFSCDKEESTNTENLYADINDGDVLDTVVKLNPKTIEGLQQQIFLPKCATSGCHDGHFEPDFRTIQSTYTTMVRAKVFKEVDPFEHRVTPGKKETSWLWERLTTDDPVLGQMPLYSDPLTKAELDNIASWIDDGAKDVNGNIMPEANANPTLYGFYITDTGANPNRYDDIRLPDNFAGSMQVPKNKMLNIWIGILDDNTDLNAFTVNELQLSTNKDDYSAAVKVTASFEFPPLVVKDFFGPGRGTAFVYKAVVNTASFNPGDKVYLRYLVSDSGHSYATKLPGEFSEWYWKDRYSMTIGK